MAGAVRGLTLVRSMWRSVQLLAATRPLPVVRQDGVLEVRPHAGLGGTADADPHLRLWRMLAPTRGGARDRGEHGPDPAVVG